MCDLNDIVLATRLIPDLKVIFTFRDPRGIFNSRFTSTKADLDGHFAMVS
jgi:hypothetical protein